MTLLTSPIQSLLVDKSAPSGQPSRANVTAEVTAVIFNIDRARLNEYCSHMSHNDDVWTSGVRPTLLYQTTSYIASCTVAALSRKPALTGLIIIGCYGKGGGALDKQIPIPMAQAMHTIPQCRYPATVARLHASGEAATCDVTR